MGKRQEMALETRQKLIDAVKRLSETKRYNEMSIDDITQEAGVAKGSFYTHFKRREDIVSVIALERFELVKEKSSADNLDIVMQISEFLIESVNIIEDNTLEVGQQWYRSVTSPVDGETLGMSKLDYDRQFISNLLKNAVDKDVLKSETDVDALTLQIVSLYYGAVALWCMSDGEISQVDIVRNFCKNELASIIGKYRI
ncbi:MAG: TetR/AcrR family transcriptional regulator [Oscillospiraceae bacterium]|nr:TetR/AcrR family transcriptional regulator [Oscillospiraceae bacterium]